MDNGARSKGVTAMLVSIPEENIYIVYPDFFPINKKDIPAKLKRIKADISRCKKAQSQYAARKKVMYFE